MNASGGENLSREDGVLPNAHCNRIGQWISNLMVANE
jgi:hypothetical protein